MKRISSQLLVLSKKSYHRQNSFLFTIFVQFMDALVEKDRETGIQYDNFVKYLGKVSKEIDKTLEKCNEHLSDTEDILYELIERACVEGDRSI